MVDRESIRELDLRQLESLSEFVSKLINSKKAERKRTVWRVCVRGMCYGNFREDEYLKAAEFLAAKAKEIDADPINDRRDRQLEIVGERVPDSEYEEWFNG
ncbi:hypothetical protein [Cedecea neteri]|uniref:hypothetical protein n=1 Tax=Cedecea neteri TaxID=158822 RepID=UPI00289D536D|nr:hypothetical protein [Cedecea neteri]